VIRVGVIGLSEGNGHPFSMSAIINGYSDEGFAQSGWSGIHDYLKRRHPSEFGMGELRVTHAWTQDPEVTKKLCKASRIDHAARELGEFIGAVDAVILARDDHEKHREMASPFLEAGLPVFIDKPLTLSPDDLAYFRPFLERGQLMSGSAMRFAKELDEVRAEIATYGQVKLIRAAVLNDWARYGVHLLDGLMPLLGGRPVSVAPHEAPHESVAIAIDNGTLVLVDALHDVPKVFRFDIFGTQRLSSHEVTDNFSMFRRMLWQFAEMIRTKRPTIPVDQTLTVVRTLIAGRIAMRERRAVRLDQV
jgi:predicted dehydrogenase